MDALPLTEFRRLDLNAVEQGIPISRLMARAGKALASTAKAMAGDAPVVLLCGKGNNGGDGFAAAGVLLRWNVDARVVLLPPKSQVRGPPRAFLDLLPPDKVVSWSRFDRSSASKALVVDCMLGSGIRGTLAKPYADAVAWLGRRRGPCLACDVPTGFGSKPTYRPDATVTFHVRKQGMTRTNCGTITVADIGLPASDVIGFGDLDAGYKRPQMDSHKGQNGRVLIVGGGPFHGAPHYAGMGAARAGADLGHVLCPEATARVLQAWGPDLLVHGASGRLCDELPNHLPLVDAVVVGPGLGTASDTLDEVRGMAAAICAQDKHLVLDADALAAFTPQTLPKGAVLTPHRKEFRRLFGRAPTPASVQKAAAATKTTIIVTGPVDLVSDGRPARKCHRGHPGMSVGGTGDVLAGVVGALLAKGASAYDAACAAAYLVGRAGEIAASLRSYGLSATDVHEAIPAVLAQLEHANR